MSAAGQRLIFLRKASLKGFLGYFSPSVLLAELGKTELGLQPQVTASCYTAMGVSALATRLCLGLITRLCGGPSALSKPSCP